MQKNYNDEGLPLPDPELIAKWRKEALQNLPSPDDWADFIAHVRWAAELDRIGAMNKDLPDRLTSIDYMLRAFLTCFLKISVLGKNGNLAPLMRLRAAIVDLANGRQSELFTPVNKKPGHPGKGVALAYVQGFAARALSELVDSGEPVKTAAGRVANALRKGRKDMRGVDSNTIKNWRARLEEGPNARGAPDDALKQYLAPLPPGIGTTSKLRGESLLKALRENGEGLG
jgi:hypothetical protein